MDYYPTHVEKHRLAGLQDAVYGIAVTLLVLELKLPNLGEGADNAAVFRALVDLLPKVFTWLLSFWVLCIYWSGDTRILRLLRSLDRWLYMACLAQLALASLLPFSTALMGEHGNLVAPSALYSLHICAMAGISTWRLWYMGRKPAYLSEDATPAAVRDLMLPTLVAMVATLAAFALSFVAPAQCMYALLLIPAWGFARRARGH